MSPTESPRCLVCPPPEAPATRLLGPGGWAAVVHTGLAAALFLYFFVAADYGAAALEAYELGIVAEYKAALAASDTAEFTALGVYALAALCCALMVHQVTAAQRGRRTDLPVVASPTSTAERPRSLVEAAPLPPRGPPLHTVAASVDAVPSGVPSW
ncbi:hypothetical protein AB0M43_11925 [Longispora sp. NPDC051575]|uniref:hypothetical protein n=1 Tax=Longispora sp. NPDC051575 TaxID=3154943 RepID=UPI0034243F10